MQDKRYLLSLEELLYNKARPQEITKKMEELQTKAMMQLDGERLRKLEHIRRGRKKCESIGAGLLLQLAVREALAEGENIARKNGDAPSQTMGECSDYRQLSFTQLCDRLADGGGPLALEYTYGSQGKPYFKNYPYYFSISHSGDYVFCVLSDREVGADIQKKSDDVNERILQRFFAPEEKEYWGKCGTEAEKSDFFYRMWCRKEAYGKLTGNGIPDAVGINMYAGENSGTAAENAGMASGDTGERQLKSPDTAWEIEEYTLADNYQIAICKWKQM